MIAAEWQRSCTGKYGTLELVRNESLVVSFLTRGYDSPPCVFMAPPFWELQWRSHLLLRHPAMKSERENRCWLAAYTRSRHESQVAGQLHAKGVESLLPTYEKFSRWSDRVRRSKAPLFPGYLTNNPRFLWDIALQFSGLKSFEVN